VHIINTLNDARQQQRIRGILGIALAISLAACADSNDAEPTPAQTAPAAPTAALSAEANPQNWPALASPIPRDEALETRVRELLATMTIEEKVGQIVQGDLGSVTPEDVKKYRLGSVLAGGNSDPGAKYNAPAADWLALLDKFHLASMDTSEGGKAIPVLAGIDAVHGHNNVVGATLFPHNIALGATGNRDLLRRIATATAIELRTTGFEWTFAPTLTVPRDDRWGRTYEGYSENPALVADYAGAVVEGLQGVVGSPEFLDGTHVLASAKHFLADGGTAGGKDQGDAQLSELELRDIHGSGYAPALQAGTQTVMASFSSWNGVKMHGNKTLLTDVLKQRMGFDGFVVGDWNAHGQVPGCTNENCAASFNAGVDMLMTPDSWRGYYTSALAQVRSGEIPMQRLDDAVTRILRVKFRLGLFEAGLPSKRLLGGKFDRLGNAEHRALAREAVRESLVLLKNNGSVLPLNPGKRVLVTGDGADNIGKQAGGWTLSWQGTGTTRADFPGAQSIWDGIKSATEAAGGKAILSADGSFEQAPDAAIVVFGEDPYAEFQGDIPNLAYRPGNDHDLELIRALKAKGIPVVAVFLSGRPLWVNREINAADAFVAAWLPGSEGSGVADVLFRSADGAVAHDFRGKLPYSWPKLATQSPLNAGQADYDPQFALGYGLSYAEPKELAALSEDSGLQQGGVEPGVYFARGEVAPGWSLLLADGEESGTAVAVLPAETPGHHLGAAAVDHLSQEDARRLQWNGGSAARAWLQTETPVDLSRESNGDVLLVTTIKIDKPPSAATRMSLRCGDGCAGQLAITDNLRDIKAATWTRMGVPLKCFAQAGADMHKISALLEIDTAGELDLSVSRVALSTDYDVLVRCPSP
jgi:beta-glucosidase